MEEYFSFTWGFGMDRKIGGREREREMVHISNEKTNFVSLEFDYITILD